MDETESNQFRPLRVVSSTVVSVSAPSRPPTCPDDVAMRRAAILLASYRKGEAEDPEIYSASVASILASYPTAIVYRVTDPRTGLPGRSQWLPTVAEVKAACEGEMAPARAEARREARRKETLGVVGEPVPGHDRAAALARIKARYADVFAPRKDGDAAEPFAHSEAWLAEYGRQPLAVGEALAAKMRAARTNPSSEI